MDAIPNRAEDLAAHWQRHDWRESFFAPGLVILQALTGAGHTASGAGLTRDEAFDRCIGETAEILALAAHRRDGGMFEPWRDGLAAHTDPARACETARAEACERSVVAQWWLGHQPAAPLSLGWIAQAGLGARLDALRKGAAMRRRTDWWQIRSECDACVMICRSMSHEGQDPVLGFGCHANPVVAADKALRELLLMELNLMELLAARSTGAEAALEPVRARIRGYARRSATLFPASAETLPAAPTEGIADFAPQPHCRVIQPVAGATGPVTVCLCQPQTPPPLFTDQSGLPYL